MTCVGGRSKKRSGKKKGGTRKCGGKHHMHGGDIPRIGRNGPIVMGGGAAVTLLGGNGRCCFKAKSCNSRKRRGNRKRKIRSGRCCLPVSMKKCGVSKRRR